MTPIDLEALNECMSCSGSLERGFSTYYQGDKAVEKICFVCRDERDLQEFIQTKRLNSHILMTAFCKLYDVPLLRQIINECHKDSDVLIERLDRVKFIARHNPNPGIADCPLPYQELVAYLDAQIGSATLGSLAKKFESKVWFAGLQDQVLNTRERGVSARPDRKDKLVVLTYTIAGRTMITIEDKKSAVTFITSDTGNEHVMGCQGVDATTEEAVELVNRAITLYQEGKLVFQLDKKVGIL